jgi:hypothetical protein
VPDYRFHFELRGIGPVSAEDLETAMSMAHTNGEPPPRIGVYGKVTGVRDGRPVGLQAIDLLQTRLSSDEAARALARALASLGVHVSVPEPEIR